ncbi:MAG: WG repeat-containing protein, partial [Bacteroidota bacterium]
NFVIQPQYDECESFTSNGIAMVRLNEKFGYIKENGDYVVEPIFERARSFGELSNELNEFADSDLAYIEFGSHSGYVTENGTFLGFTLDDVKKAK